MKEPIKRGLAIVAGTILMVVAMATAAVAQYPPTSQPGDPQALGAPTSNGTLPFTGLALTSWLLILGGMVMLGVLLLAMGRRRQQRV